MKQIKLKQITERIAVHTPTEEEANELLAILHAIGYEWFSGDSLISDSFWYRYKKGTAYCIDKNMRVSFCNRDRTDGHFLSFDEFKRMYCEEEKPHNEALKLQGFAEGTLLFVRKTNDLRALLIMLHDNGYKPSKEYTKYIDGFIPAIEIMPDKEFRLIPIIHNEQIKGGINGSTYVELLDMYATLGKFTKDSITALGGLVKPEKNMKKFKSIDELAQAHAKSVVACSPEHSLSEGLIATSVVYGVNEAWRNLATLTFGQAIDALKHGCSVTRKGWNGKGLMVFKQVPAHIDGAIIPKMQSLPQSAKEQVMKHTGFIDYTSQCLIYNSQTGRADSWVPSISDVFANDWEIVAE